MLVMGIDLGTSAVKALVVDPARLEPLAASERPCTVAAPQEGWSEQDPAQWWEAACVAIRQAIELAGERCGEPSTTIAARIQAVGLAGQMHGLVALDRALRPVRPCILWNDQRSAPQCDALHREPGLPRLLEWTGNRVHPGFTLPKVLWMREHEPALLRAARHILLPKDWLRWRLCGALGQDVTDASGTSMFDPGRRRWSKEVMDSVGLDDSLLPPVHESSAVVGAVTSEAGAATGLRSGTPVVAGAGDQAAAALGLGVVEEGACSATIGTSGVVFVARARHAPDEEGRLHAFCHAAPDLWHQMGVVLSAGGALRWFRNVLARDAEQEARESGRDAYAVIADRASEAPPGCDGLTFLPSLCGERTPHADPDARGALLNLSIRHDRRHVARAVLEGITFALADCLALVRATGAAPCTVRLTGGGARSTFWCQLCADAFECEVLTASSSAGSAMGAAILAGIGSGLWPDARTAASEIAPRGARYRPNGDSRLREALARYRAVCSPVRQALADSRNLQTTPDHPVQIRRTSSQSNNSGPSFVERI